MTAAKEILCVTKKCDCSMNFCYECKGDDSVFGSDFALRKEKRSRAALRPPG